MAQDEAALIQSEGPRPGRHGLQQLLRQRGVPAVDFAAWQRLDAAEVEAGRPLGAARVKAVALSDMLAAAGVPAGAAAA